MNARQLAAYSKSLISGNVVNLARAKPDKLVKCLAQDGINTQGAGIAAKRLVLDALQGLPSSDITQISRLQPPIRRLLLALLEYEPLVDPVIEKTISHLRRSLLHSVVTNQVVEGFAIDLAAALGIFGFNHDFVLSESASEAFQRQNLSAEIPIHLAVLSAYEALKASTETRNILSQLKGQHVSHLICVQIDEPLRERELIATIPSLGELTNEISDTVRSQYEENPYPRWWRMADLSGVPKHDATNILIAGCGTGWEALEVALANRKTSVTALDLSGASLAYAARQAEKYNVENIKFIQGDILSLSGPPSYDLVISSGVLHHMEEPSSGLRALRGVLHDDGTLRLALYTESGRAPVVECIKIIEKLGIKSSPDGMRKLREEIYKLPQEHIVRELLGWADFYVLSDLRDLVFHVQEHRYTFPKIEVFLKDGGFKFESLLPPSRISNEVAVEFSNTPLDDLKALATFEKKHPGAFGSMYHFTARPA